MRTRSQPPRMGFSTSSSETVVNKPSPTAWLRDYYHGRSSKGCYALGRQTLDNHTTAGDGRLGFGGVLGGLRLRPLQHFPDLFGQGVRRERLLQERHLGLDNAVAEHAVVGVTALEQHF